MLIFLKNKDTLIVDDFKFKCSIGKNGKSKKKVEGDKCTPKGIFGICSLYFRKDRNKKPKTDIKTRIIKKNMGWCDDPKSKLYNKEIIINKITNCEKLFRKDNIYDFLLVIKYNTKKTKSLKGSAIFIHLTKNYKPTAGCIALKQKDFLIMLKLINKKVKIKIS